MWPAPQRPSETTHARTLAAIAFPICCVLLLAGCEIGVSASPTPTSGPAETPRQQTFAMPSRTPAATDTPSPASLPSPVPADALEGACPPEGNLLLGGEFQSGLEDWEARYGLLRHTLKTYVGEPGAAMVTTSHTDPNGGHLAVAGRCVDLAPTPEGPGQTHDQAVAIEAYLLAMPETESVSLSVFFHAEAGCRGDILEVAGPPAVSSDSGWIFVSQLVSMPGGARAVDFVLRAASQSSSGRALVDRACIYLVPGPE